MSSKTLQLCICGAKQVILCLAILAEKTMLLKTPNHNLFFSLLEKVLERFEQEHGATLLVATLCLLEVSAAGLLESELLAMLGDKDTLIPPSPFDEKGIGVNRFSWSISNLPG